MLEQNLSGNKNKEKNEFFKRTDSGTENSRPPERPHAIQAYFVGLPGEERLVADTLNKKQVGVAYFEGTDIVGVEDQIIKGSENLVAAQWGRLSPSDFSRMAEDTLAESRIEAHDMGQISALLGQRRDQLLLVDVNTIDDPSDKKEGLHLLGNKSDLEKLKPLLDDLGYKYDDVSGSRLEAIKGKVRLVFLYAEEK